MTFQKCLFLSVLLTITTGIFAASFKGNFPARLLPLQAQERNFYSHFGRGYPYNVFYHPNSYFTATSKHPSFDNFRYLSYDQDQQLRTVRNSQKVEPAYEKIQGVTDNSEPLLPHKKRQRNPYYGRKRRSAEKNGWNLIDPWTGHSLSPENDSQLKVSNDFFDYENEQFFPEPDVRVERNNPDDNKKGLAYLDHVGEPIYRRIKANPYTG